MTQGLRRLLIVGGVSVLSLIVSFGSAHSAFAYTSPGQPVGYVNDFANILSDAQEQVLEEQVQTFEKQTGNEIAVVTIQTTGDETVESYAVTLFKEWGIGKAETDNGVLLLVATDDRKMRIEVGYGLEPILTDAKSALIIRSATPLFKSGDYDQGTIKMATDIQSVLSGDEQALVASTIEASRPADMIWTAAMWLMLIFGGLFLFAAFVVSMVIRRLIPRNRRAGGPDIIYWGKPSDSSDSSSSSSSGSSSSFGGGSSGGGGASGGW